MNEFDHLDGNLPCLKRIICVSAEFAFLPLAIAIANGVAVAAHWPTLSVVHVNPCSAT